jgi:hypothetical protein
MIYGEGRGSFLKKEMDIAVFTPDKEEKHCIEIKYPTGKRKILYSKSGEIAWGMIDPLLFRKEF